MDFSARWSLTALIIMAAIFLRQITWPNADTAWLLAVAEGMQKGGVLYRDLLETNPPASVWLHLPFVKLASTFGGRAEDWLAASLILLSLAVSIMVARQWSAAKKLQPLLLASFLLMPGYCFGEREHLVLLLAWVAIVLAVARLQQQAPPLWLILLGGLSEGMSVIIKPHFALAFIFMAIFVCATTRSLRALFAPEHLIGAALALAYAALVVALYPVFVTDLWPLLRDVYLSASTPLLEMMDGLLLPLLAAHALLGLWLWRAAGDQRLSLLLIHMAASGFALAAILQGKGWFYHFLPMLGLDAMTVALAIHLRGQFWASIAAGSALSFAVWSSMSHAMEFWQLAQELRAKGRMSAAVLTSDLAVAFPLLRMGETQFVDRSYARWISIHALGLAAQAGPELRARLALYEREDRALFVEMMRRHAPDLLLVERGPIDFVAWSQRDPAIAAMLACYEPRAREEIAGGEIALELHQRRQEKPLHELCLHGQ